MFACILMKAQLLQRVFEVQPQGKRRNENGTQAQQPRTCRERTGGKEIWMGGPTQFPRVVQRPAPLSTSHPQMGEEGVPLLHTREVPTSKPPATSPPMPKMPLPYALASGAPYTRATGGDRRGREAEVRGKGPSRLS